MATIERYQTTNGETAYRVRYRTPDHRTTSKRGFTTKRDAELFAATVEVSKARGEYVAPSVGKTTIGELGTPWLERQRGHTKPSTARSYESAWRIHVAPQWADKHLADIRYSDVAAWVAELGARRGRATVVMAYQVLARILDDAVRDKMLAANPARGVKLPKPQPRRNVYLTADQLQRLADESGDYRSLVLLLGVGGLRWGEAAALRVCDVDFLRRRIELHRNAVQIGHGFAVGSLKSNKNRVVVLPAFVMDALAQTAQGKGRDDLLWPSRVGSYLGTPSSAESWLGGAVRRCQKADPTFPRVTAHSLRHSGVSSYLGRCESESGSTDARPRQRRDDTRRLRRFVRLRPGGCRGKCVQNVATAGITAHF